MGGTGKRGEEGGKGGGGSYNVVMPWLGHRRLKLDRFSLCVFVYAEDVNVHIRGGYGLGGGMTTQRTCQNHSGKNAQRYFPRCVL